nr:reverse transcriptase domain-containing protein [Tanacetum cinerariifolium]
MTNDYDGRSKLSPNALPHLRVTNDHDCSFKVPSHVHYLKENPVARKDKFPNTQSTSQFVGISPTSNATHNGINTSTRERKPRKRQNRIKTGQKRKAWRTPEKSKAVTVKKERKTKERCAEAIVVPPILAEQFELKHSLIKMMTSEQFFGLEKDNPHDHIRWGSAPVARKRTLASEIAKLTHAVNQQTSAVTTAMTAMLKQLQANPPPAPVKAVEEIYVTCGGAHPYYQCLAAVATLFQNSGTISKVTFQQPHATTIRTSLLNQTNEIKNMMASLLQMNTASTSGSGSLLGNTVANPKGELKAITTRSGASINLMPLSVWRKLGLPDLIPTRMTLELANRAICTPDGIARDVFVPVGKFTFLDDFVVVDYESDPKVTLILERPFLRTARALINVHDIDSFNDIHPHFDDNPLSGSTTYSSNSLLEEFTDELALITYPPDYDDNLQCDIESDLREIEFLLYQGKDSGFKDSIDQTNLANFDDYFVDPTPEMFINEHAPDYSFPLRFDVYDDDFLEIEFDADNFYDDPFDSKGEKIKESKLLIDELDLPCDFLPYSEYDSFNSQDFFRDDDLPSQQRGQDVPKSMRLIPFSSENKEKVFKPGIYTSEKIHSCFLPELSHPGYHVFKVNQIFISMTRIFHVQCGKNTPLLDVLLFHFYPP